MSTGAIIGIAVAVPVGVLAILAILGYYLWKHHKTSKASKSQRLAEVNDYSFNPNNTSSLDIGTASGGGSGAAGAMLVGAAAGGAGKGQSNYRGWGPAPTSPQMEQIPGTALTNLNGLNGGSQSGVAKTAVVGAGAGAVARSGSSSRDGSGGRGSNESLQRGSPDGIDDTSSGRAPVIAGFYDPTPREDNDQFQYSQQRPYQRSFDFDTDPEPPAPRLQIHNVTARRESPNVEHNNGWSGEGAAGTRGVSQNF